MATTDIAEKKTEKEYEVYPVAELVNAVNRMLSEKIPVKIALVSSETGDVAFMAELSELGITQQAFDSHPFFTSNLWSDLLGQLLIRQNMGAFCDRVMNKSIKYDSLVKAYNHTGMGLRLVKNDKLMFQFHVSLIFRLFNELISHEIAGEASKVIISSAQKIKREEEAPSIVSFSNDAHGLRLIVSNHSSVRRVFEKAIGSILDFYSIKNKEILVIQNALSYEIQIKDAGK